MKKAVTLSYFYSALSVFIGPVIVFVLPDRHPSGWDCYDPSWGATPLREREAFYEHAARFMAPAANTMLILGVLVLTYLAYSCIKNKQLKQLPIPAFLVLFMLAGYWLIHTVANSRWC